MLESPIGTWVRFLAPFMLMLCLLSRVLRLENDMAVMKLQLGALTERRLTTTATSDEVQIDAIVCETVASNMVATRIHNATLSWAPMTMPSSTTTAIPIPAIAQVHLTVGFSPSTTSGPADCSYAQVGRFTYENIGSVSWEQCVVEASKRGAFLASTYYSVRQGWQGHRRGDVAMVSNNDYKKFEEKSIVETAPCVLGRDFRSTKNGVVLSQTASHGGLAWMYQDYGLKYFDECMLLANNAGAIIITPYTVGRKGDGYWVFSTHLCNQFCWISGSGLNLGSESKGRGARSCMVGYVSATGPVSSSSTTTTTTTKSTKQGHYMGVSNVTFQPTSSSSTFLILLESAWDISVDLALTRAVDGGTTELVSPWRSPGPGSSVLLDVDHGIRSGMRVSYGFQERSGTTWPRYPPRIVVMEVK